MPDSHGWHSEAFRSPDGRLLRWHYCEGAERDTLVADTPEARRAHERACHRRRKLAREQAERARIMAATARLRDLNRLRRESRLVTA